MEVGPYLCRLEGLHLDQQDFVQLLEELSCYLVGLVISKGIIQICIQDRKMA